MGGANCIYRVLPSNTSLRMSSPMDVFEVGPLTARRTPLLEPVAILHPSEKSTLAPGDAANQDNCQDWRVDPANGGT